MDLFEAAGLDFNTTTSTATPTTTPTGNSTDNPNNYSKAPKAPHLDENLQGKEKQETSETNTNLQGVIKGDKQVGKITTTHDFIVATDGACSGNPGPGGWAWVDQKTGNHKSGGNSSTTNNIMELTALIEALKYVPNNSSLLLRSDSQYAINTMTKWAASWKRKNWKKSDGKPVKNLELVKQLLYLYESRVAKTDIEWVRGHNGDEANELCDKLAVAESKTASK